MYFDIFTSSFLAVEMKGFSDGPKEKLNVGDEALEAR